MIRNVFNFVTNYKDSDKRENKSIYSTTSFTPYTFII